MKNKLLLFCCCVCCCLSACLISSVRADAAVYTSDNGLTVWGQLYEDYKNSGTGASVYGFYKQSIRYNDTNGATVEKWFMIPYYLDAEKCAKLASCHYECIKDRSEWDACVFSDAVFPAILDYGCRTYTCSGWHTNSIHDHSYDGNIYTSFKANPVSFDPETFEFSCNVPSFLHYDDNGDFIADGFVEYYTYLATGIITDPSLVELPEGYTIDDDGKLQEVEDECVAYVVSYIDGMAYSRFYKRLYDRYDSKLCFYLDNVNYPNDKYVYHVYTESDMVNREYVSVLKYEGDDDPPFVYRGYYVFGGVPFLSYDPSSDGDGSHGGGHFGVPDGETNDALSSLYYLSLYRVTSGYPFVVSGCYDLCFLAALNMDDVPVGGFVNVADFVRQDYPDGTDVGKMYSTEQNIKRPVFISKDAAQQWYSDSTCEASDIYYKPKGYFYHSSTKILDKNPLSDSDDSDSDVGVSVDDVPSASSTVEKTVVTSGAVIVNVDVDQSNDNDLTAIATASAVNDVQVDSSGSGDAGAWIPESDDDSLFDIVGDVVDDEDDDWTDMIRYAFGFLPVKIQELLSGSVIIGIIVGLLRRR